MQRATIKTSTIFIAKGGKTRVYRSVSEVPPTLRKQLEESTNSFNSATILIADRRGREEILKALNGMPSGLLSRLASSLAPRAAVTESQPVELQEHATAGVLGFLRRYWLEITLPCAIAVVVWAVVNFH